LSVRSESRHDSIGRAQRPTLCLSYQGGQHNRAESPAHRAGAETYYTVEFSGTMRENQTETGAEIHTLREAHQELVARVSDLEKLRALRALWARLFGRRKPQPVQNVAAA